MVFLGLVRFGFSSDSDGFLRMLTVFLGMARFGFSLDRIIRALQQYKDAKIIPLPISYSTGQGKASIFGKNRAMNGILTLLKR